MIGIGATLILTSPTAASPAATGAFSPKTLKTPKAAGDPKILAGARVAPWIGPSGAGVSLEGQLW
jgi:hypothetical protein